MVFILEFALLDPEIPHFQLDQLTTCLHQQHDQHKVRIVRPEARREDVTTAGPRRHLPKPIQQKQLITFEVLLSNYKVSEKL